MGVERRSVAPAERAGAGPVHHGQDDAVGRQVQDIIFPPLVSFSLLGVALVLSVWKPWGRTRWGRRRLGARAAD